MRSVERKALEELLDQRVGLIAEAVAQRLSQDDRPLRQAALCELLDVSRSTLYEWRKSDPTFPKPAEGPWGDTRWLMSDVQAWLRSKRESSTTSAT